MTNEEAINVLRWLNPPRANKKSFDDFMQAIGMAIEALEQAKTNCSEIPNNSDTIYRQQAIDALRKMQTYKMFAGDDMLLIDQAEAQTELMMLPSAQPERKDAIEKAVAVEAISDELLSRFDISATYAYDVAENAMNRIEAMAKEMGKGEQDG